MPGSLIEVLSPSTAEYDEGEKLAHYERIPSLRHIVIAAQDEARVDVWARSEAGVWTVARRTASAVARLGAIDAELPLGDVYSDPLV